MSNSNGRIYTETKDGITYGVSINDVLTVLGSNSLDLGTLCTSSNINMWAKYKPETSVTNLVDLDTVNPITLEKRTLNGFGIEARTNQGYGNISGLVSDLRSNTANNPFSYKSAEPPYRLTDFENYYHLAPCPIVAPYTSTDYLGVTLLGTLLLYYYVNIVGSEYVLGLKDLRLLNDSNQLSEYYFGILIYNNSTYSAATQSTKMGTTSVEGLDVLLTDVPLTLSIYQMVPFFSTLPFTEASDSGVKTIYPMVWASLEILTIPESSYVTIDVEGYIWGNNLNELIFEYSVTNNTSGTHRFNTSAYGASTSYIEVGILNSSPCYDRWPINIDIEVPAGLNVSGTYIVTSNLDGAQISYIENGDSKVYISANKYNGRYTYDGIIQIRTLNE